MYADIANEENKMFGGDQLFNPICEAYASDI